MKIIIAGGRDFNDIHKVMESVDHHLSKCKHLDIEIVSGTANGADKLGEEYAELRDYKVAQFKPDWDKYGKGAGYKRNVEMADYADALVAFWDGKSKGTMHMINIAKKKGIQVKIIKY
jgi:hypothetical protein